MESISGGWSLIASVEGLESCNTEYRVFVERGKTEYTWQGMPLFSLAGLDKRGIARLAVWLVSEESSTGRILCFACNLRLSDLQTEYPPQMTVNNFSGKPRRNSVRFAPGTAPPAARVLQLQSETHGGDARFIIQYECMARYGSSGTSGAQVQLHLQIFSMELRLNEYRLLEAYFKRPEGHRLAMHCNGQYVGGAQSIQQNSVTQHWTYTWQTTTKRPPTPRMTKEELYDVSIIEGMDEPTSSPSLGSLMSPRVTNGKIKTPRPASHVQRTMIVMPPYVPDSPEKKNETRRLYAIIEKQGPSMMMQLFNFRFMPPRRVAHRLTWKDFKAAYDRTVAQCKVPATSATPTSSSRFSLKRRLSARDRESKRHESCSHSASNLCRSDSRSRADKRLKGES